MFHGAFRCPKAVASSSTRAMAPPPGMRMIWVSGETGCVAVATEHVDRLVGQLGEEVGRPVVLHALRVAGVEQLLHRRVRHRLRPGRAPAARTRAAARATSSPSAGRRRSSTTTPTTGWPRTGSGTNSSGGAVMNASRRRPRRARRHEVAAEAQRARRPSGRVHEHPAEHDRPDRVQPELELGDDAEVAAAAAQPPEQVGVLVVAARHDLRRRRSRPRPRAGCRTSRP